MAANLKLTVWYEGDHEALLKPTVHDYGYDGGWTSVDALKRKRLADYRHHPRATAVETEFGIRADTDMGNGVTMIEVLELIPA